MIIDQFSGLSKDELLQLSQILIEAHEADDEDDDLAHLHSGLSRHGFYINFFNNKVNELIDLGFSGLIGKDYNYFSKLDTHISKELSNNDYVRLTIDSSFPLEEIKLLERRESLWNLYINRIHFSTIFYDPTYILYVKNYDLDKCRLFVSKKEDPESIEKTKLFSANISDIKRLVYYTDEKEKEIISSYRNSINTTINTKNNRFLHTSIKYDIELWLKNNNLDHKSLMYFHTIYFEREEDLLLFKMTYL